jgi:hypothetical protein
MGSNPGRRSSKPTNNRSSYGTVYKLAVHKYGNLSLDTERIL